MPEAGHPLRPAYSLYRWYWHSLDWLFPPKCGGCDRPGKRWCGDCQSKVKTISTPICSRCGDPINYGSVCHHCLEIPPRYRSLRSYAEFDGGIRSALHRLKYRRDVSLGEALSVPLIEFFRQLDWAVDLVTPVPLGRARQKDRGYNQADLIARPLALALGLPYTPNALHRSRETSSQVGLSISQRRENVAAAFIGNRDIVTSKKVLVLDDVTTTGATISACADALENAGAEIIYGLTLARAVLQQNQNSSK